MSAEEKAATDGGEEEVEKVVIPGPPDAMLKVAVGPMVLIFRGGLRVGARTAWTRGFEKAVEGVFGRAHQNGSGGCRMKGEKRLPNVLFVAVHGSKALARRACL